MQQTFYLNRSNSPREVLFKKLFFATKDGETTLYKGTEEIGKIFLLGQPVNGNSFLITFKTQSAFVKRFEDAKKALVNKYMFEVLDRQNR